MPNAGTYGLVNFADNFTKSFLQAKLLKHQEKLETNLKAAGLLKDQLADETIPYAKRAAILDEMGRLLGAKEPLSQRIGMDKWNDQMVDDPNKPLTKTQLPITDRSTDQLGVVNAAEAGNSLPIDSSQAQEGIIGGQPQQSKLGTLSPADLKLNLKLKADAAESKLKVAEQEKIIAFQINKQQEYLDANGWEKQGDLFYNNDTKKWNQTWFNPRTNQQRVQEYPQGYDPLTLITAKIKANKPQGKLGQLQMAHEIMSTYEANPNLIPKFQYDAAKDLIDDFNRNGRLADAKIDALNMAISGAKPITPQQDTTNTRLRAKDLADLQKDIDTAKSNESSALDAREKLGAEKTKALESYNNAEAKFKVAESKFTPNDAEYKNAYAAMQTAKNRFDDLQKRYDVLHGNYTKARIDREGAEGRLSAYNTNTAGSGGGSGEDLSQYAAWIAAARKQNPEINDKNSPKYMSDADIVAAGRRQGKLK